MTMMTTAGWYWSQQLDDNDGNTWMMMTTTYQGSLGRNEGNCHRNPHSYHSFSDPSGKERSLEATIHNLRKENLRLPLVIYPVPIIPSSLVFIKWQKSWFCLEIDIYLKQLIDKNEDEPMLKICVGKTSWMTHHCMQAVKIVCFMVIMPQKQSVCHIITLRTFF